MARVITRGVLPYTFGDGRRESVLAKLLFPNDSTLPSSVGDGVALALLEAGTCRVNAEPPTPWQTMTRCLTYLLRHGRGLRLRNLLDDIGSLDSMYIFRLLYKEVDE